MKKRHLAMVAAVALPTMFGSLALGPASADAATPSITSSGCGSAQAQWVHVYFTHGSSCYAGAGKTGFGGNSTVAFCAGNNGGSFTYWTGSREVTEQFWPGTQINWTSPVDMLSLTITGWSGPFTC